MKLNNIHEFPLPSIKDLESAIVAQQMNKPAVIFKNGNYLLVQVIDGKTPKINPTEYETLKASATDIDEVIDYLNKSGFSVTAKSGARRFGKTIDPNIEKLITKTASEISQSGSREVGGIRAVDQKKTQTPYDYVEKTYDKSKDVTGTPESVEIEIPEDEVEGISFHTHPDDPKGGYDPDEILRGTDQTGIKRKSKKTTNNNYFP